MESSDSRKGKLKGNVASSPVIDDPAAQRKGPEVSENGSPGRRDLHVLWVADNCPVSLESIKHIKPEIVSDIRANFDRPTVKYPWSSSD